MIETPERIAFLKKIHLFYGLGDDELGAIAEKLDEISIPDGGVVFEQGAKSEAFYMIYRGSVRISQKKQGKENQLALLVKDDYFGEMGLIDRRKRSGTVTATSNTSLLLLKRQDFEIFYKKLLQLRSNMSIAVQSRKLARTLQFKWLRPDEVIYFLARKHRIIMYQKLILPILSFLVPLFLFYGWFFYIDYSIVLLAAALSLLACIGWVAWEIVDWGNDYYIVTNQRVVWLEKVIGIYDSRQESPLSTIISVGVETNQVGRLLDYGNVIIRTFVGMLPFNHVTHPDQAKHMIEEYWDRTKEDAVGIEKEAMKNAIRKKLNLPEKNVPLGFGEPAPVAKKDASPPKRSEGTRAILKFLGANTLKLRYETGENMVYRKHWVVLLMQAWMPFIGSFALLVSLLVRLVMLAFDPAQSLLYFQDKFSMDTWVIVFLLAFIPFAGWLIYEVIDWSNDRFEVTSEQIIDIDRKPFGTETRNAAQLENILGTNYERRGILGNLFNFGTVHITVGGSKMAFEDVLDPATVQSDIDRRRMARKAKQDAARIAGERERMAEWLATYHRAAQEFLDEEKKNKPKLE